MIIIKSFSIDRHMFHINFLFTHFKRNPTLWEIDKYLSEHLVEIFPTMADYLHFPLVIGRVKALRKMCPSFTLDGAKQYIDFLVQIEEEKA